MSAFMVEDRTINEIVTWLRKSDGNCWDLLMDGGWDLDASGAERLARAMFALNVAAVEGRYGKGEAGWFRQLDFAWHPQQAHPVQVFKSLECWLYQCAEDVTVGDPLFRLMLEILKRMAMRIVRRSEEYREARWG